jgi:uncharacterized protein YoxC
MVWENWLIAISVLLIALAFVVLAIFIIVTLLSLKRVVTDLDDKVRAFDPIFRVVNQAGSIIEKKADKIQHALDETGDDICRKCEQRRESHFNVAMEVAEWAIIGLSLWQKFKERKKRS